MTMTDTRDPAPVVVEVWNPPWKARPIIAAVIVAILLVVSAPIVALVAHQVRIDKTQSATVVNATGIARLNRLERDLAAEIKQEAADRAEAHYENCESLLKMWTIDNAATLFETSPGPERSTLLAMLPPQPHCVKP